MMSFRDLLNMADQTELRRDAEDEFSALVRSVLHDVHASWQEQNAILRGLLGAGTHVDEMALLFAGEHALAAFVRYAVRERGYELFNTAWDHVATGPILSHYDVSYWFLRTPGYEPGKKGYRLELMSLLSHGSPLHDRMAALATGEMRYRPVHASFKCPDEEAYGTAVNTLRKGGYELAQRCSSSYGQFSYWQHYAAEGTPGWFLKPRVNLRDEDVSE